MPCALSLPRTVDFSTPSASIQQILLYICRGARELPENVFNDVRGRVPQMRRRVSPFPAFSMAPRRTRCALRPVPRSPLFSQPNAWRVQCARSAGHRGVELVRRGATDGARGRRRHRALRGAFFLSVRARFRPGASPTPRASAPLTTRLTAVSKPRQADKLPFGTSKSTVAFFDHTVLVQLDVCPLVVSLVGAADANVGALLDLAPQLKSALEPVRRKADDELS